MGDVHEVRAVLRWPCAARARESGALEQGAGWRGTERCAIFVSFVPQKVVAPIRSEIPGFVSGFFFARATRPGSRSVPLPLSPRPHVET
eukprot:7166103-Prymnesium_polylepis.1